MPSRARIAGLLCTALACGPAPAQTADRELPATGPAAEAPKPKQEPAREQGRINVAVDPESYPLVRQARGLSAHRPSYVFPATYSPDFRSERTEMVFQISAKQRLFNRNIYLAYTQKSFWQFLNQDESSPFRETNYDPEIFYRWTERHAPAAQHWGADFGLIEHESNGREFPFSRSWNRIYFAPFRRTPGGLVYLKLWYRIPEGQPSTLEDPTGDDNPDITDYLGYGELLLARQLGGGQRVVATLRGNPQTGKGAVALNWSLPADDFFWGLSVFHGYGESLSVYDKSLTRVMLGIMLAR